jgi:hypothetical protein
MKSIKRVLCTSVAIATASTALLIVTPNAFAIEGLRISVQYTNVILGWPSAAGEYYIVQWRPTLSTSTPWTTLTNSLPANPNGNWTTFVDINRVQFAAASTNNGVWDTNPPTVPDSMDLSTSVRQLSEPMVMSADGSGGAVPLCIYPPGSDLTGLLIYEPSTGESESGDGYTVSQPSLNRLQRNDPQPMDDSGGGNPPDPGFYQVVQDGVRIQNSSLSNLTSAPVSNTIAIYFEAGNAVGTLQEVYVLVDGIAYRGSDAIIGQPFYPGALTVDTSFLENGDHTFQVEAGWVNPDIGDLGYSGNLVAG